MKKDRKLRKVKNLSNKEEAYKLGRRKGFGKGLGLCIAFLRKKGQPLCYSFHYQILEKEMIDYVLQRRL